MKCPKCQADNPETKQFCGDCGTQLPAPRPQDHPPVVTETIQTVVRELTTGSTFAGRYQVIEELGHGGMGKVYKVHDTKVGEKIALKLIRPEAELETEAIERFSNELKLARKIRHKNVCQMFDLGEDRGVRYITMEYVHGENLRQLIRKVGRLSPGQAIAIARQVCAGLGEAHRLEVVHRDLKPQNIMLDEDGNARIMDFGIARSLTGRSITGAGTFIGTPEYMSPEQVEGEDVDARSDIYSLGVVLYEMLTGRRPFEGDTALSVAVKHKSETPPDPKLLNPQVSDDLSRVILKCLEKRRERRYQSGMELQSALEEAEMGLPTTEKTLAKEPGIVPDEKRTWRASVAVLPFTNISADPEQDYFCDGMAEEIINALTHVDGLRVVARTSAFSFKGKNINVREIGRELAVEAVLEGSVRKAGNRLRITAQLINVADGFHLWSERFDREMKDIFDIQDEVTLEIVDKLKIELLGIEKKQLVKRYTDNVEAYHLLLKGRYFWSRRTQEGLMRGLECLEQALKIDPHYALAHAHIAMNLVSVPVFGLAPPHETYPKAKVAARKAIEIDSSLSKAHAALAFISLFYDYDWAAAEKGFQKALSLNPGLDYAHFGMAWYLASQGRLEEAVLAQKKAVDLDPLSLWMNADLGCQLFLARRYDEAREQLEKSLAMDPNFSLTHAHMGSFLCEKGLYPEAIAEFQKAIGLTGGLSWAYGGLGYAYAVSGHKDEAEKVLQALEERSRKGYFRSFLAALTYLGLRDFEKTFEFLERAIAEREPMLFLLKTDRLYDFVRQDPRFRALLKKMNLDQ